jgi:YhcH/YjgK/YiaL family protein
MCLGRYGSLSPALAAAVAWIGGGVWRLLPDGRHEPREAIPAEGGTPLFYASISSYDAKDAAECRYETHRRFIDVQILLSGREAVDVRSPVGLPVTVPYDPEKDITFFGEAEGGAHRVHLEPGVAAVFFPDDAHKPCIAIDADVAVRKIVVKVAV